MRPRQHSCPGSRMMAFKKEPPETHDAPSQKVPSQLTQGPIQLHLILPVVPCYQEADVLLTADCVACAFGDFHGRFMKGHSLAIACPKLDSGQEIYPEKIATWIDEANIRSLHVLIMQVPCCMGLLNLAQKAAQQARRSIPIEYTIVGVEGDILEQKCIQVDTTEKIV